MIMFWILACTLVSLVLGLLTSVCYDTHTIIKEMDNEPDNTQS
jgi:hypothetical protein